MRVQEVIHRVRPDLIIETGVAHGGSLVLYASLLEAIGGGEVIGVEIDIRPHNRAAIESHPLARRISLIEGGSTDVGVIDALRQHAAGKRSVLVILDSNHSYAHVAAELAAYAPFVTPGSYVIATDGIMEDLWDAPRGDPSWREDNPARAARDFAALHPEFVLEVVPPPFNEGSIPGDAVTHWPSAYLRRA
jgi:cephalosporin hydroxylase